MKESQTAATHPFTGNEFLASLQDDREVWIYGERVKDVTSHPAFRNPARMIARLYDALHDPATRDQLTVPTDTGNHAESRVKTMRLCYGTPSAPSSAGATSCTSATTPVTTRTFAWRTSGSPSGGGWNGN